MSMEERSIKAQVTVSIPQWDLFCRYSSYDKLIRVTAYCQRFVNNIRSGQLTRKYSKLSTNELESAEELCVRLVQYQGLGELMSLLRKGKTKHPFTNLHPFLSEMGSSEWGVGFIWQQLGMTNGIQCFYLVHIH